MHDAGRHCNDREPGTRLSEQRFPPGLRGALAAGLVALGAGPACTTSEPARPESPAAAATGAPELRWRLSPVEPAVDLPSRFVRLEFGGDAVHAPAWGIVRPENGSDAPALLNLRVPGAYEGGELYLVAEQPDGTSSRIKPRAGDGRPHLYFILPAGMEARRLGVEYVPTSAVREEALHAYGAARSLGIQAFPLAAVGERWEWEIRTDDGEIVSSASLRGKVVIVDHWATYCAACLYVAAPLVREIAAAHPDDVVLIEVNIDGADRSERVAEHREQFPEARYRLTVPHDSEGFELYARSLTGRVDLGGIPLVIVTDSDGTVSYIGNCGDRSPIDAVLRSNGLGNGK